MKRILTLTAVFALISVAAPQAYVISDNFNDGNADGWWLAAPNYPSGYGYPVGTGNWRIDGTVLTQDEGGDQYKALVTDSQFGSQTIETTLRLNGGGTNGYGGVTLWYQGANSWIDVAVYPSGTEPIIIVELAPDKDRNITFYDPNVNIYEGPWYSLKVVAGDQNGYLDIYLNNQFILTYDSIRSGSYWGLSGLNSGNGGGDFDDFRVSGDINPVPEPTSMLLFGTGLVCYGAYRKIRFKREMVLK